MVTIFAVYITGLLSGAAIALCFVMGLGYLTAKKQMKLEGEIKKELRNINAERERHEEEQAFVIAKIEQAKQVITKQNKLLTIDHAMSSNDAERTRLEWATLEQQKNSIFREILATGLDPIINVYDPVSGRFEEMKLSELMAKPEKLDSPVKNTTSNVPDAIAKSTNNMSISKKINKDGKVFYLITKNNKDEPVN